MAHDKNDHPQSSSNSAADPAVNLIRSKIDALYEKEPSAKEEIAEVQAKKDHLSKHQRFMQDLNSSGKSIAEIQTEWHKYYQALPDDEKHAVWQEFYDMSAKKRLPQASHPPKETHVYHEPEKASTKDKQSVAQVKKRITSSIARNQKAKLSAKAHFKSLAFGLGMGFLTLIVLLFSFFNERFVAPFITPSKSVSSTPIIIDPNSTEAGPETLVIIPKINVEVPVVYDASSTQEKDIQTALERGVVHYSSTSNPGEVGNTVVVGHSSNNLLNSGKYKFAFVLLNKLEVGDTFSLTKNSKRYVYKVYDKKIVKPTDTSVLGPADKPATATLITCDPPGTSINRLIVLGEQISPDPSANTASTATTAPGQSPSIIPGNAQSLWSRLTAWIRT